MQPKILALAGSLRAGSFNKKLLLHAVAAGHKVGAAITHIDLKDYPLPIYNGDDEEAHGLPDNAKRLKALFMEHQGFLLALPEYNSSMSAAFKNTIDWVSRPVAEESEYLICFKNKLAALLSASPGALGGLRGLMAAKSVLENIGTMVLPTHVTLPKANAQFDPNGMLMDDAKSASIASLMSIFWQTLTKLYT